jgi:predicted ABC-type ATPase
VTSDHRQLWVLAGGNGAGKSTFFRLFLQPLGVGLVNADEIARRFYPGSPAEHGYEAAALAERLRTTLVRAGRSFCFETVFSHPSKIDFLAEAWALHYEVILVYVHLESADLNEARVAQRVCEGGHDVPADKIRSRLPRTMRNVRAALPLVDRAQLYDNSRLDDPFRAVATLVGGRVEPYANPLPPWAEQLLGDHL